MARSLLLAGLVATRAIADQQFALPGWKFVGCVETNDAVYFPFKPTFDETFFSAQACQAECGEKYHAKYAALGGGCHCNDPNSESIKYTAVEPDQCMLNCVPDDPKAGFCGGGGFSAQNPQRYTLFERVSQPLVKTIKLGRREAVEVPVEKAAEEPEEDAEDDEDCEDEDEGEDPTGQGGQTGTAPAIGDGGVEGTGADAVTTTVQYGAAATIVIHECPPDVKDCPYRQVVHECPPEVKDCPYRQVTQVTHHECPPDVVDCPYRQKSVSSGSSGGTNSSYGSSSSSSGSGYSTSQGCSNGKCGSGSSGTTVQEPSNQTAGKSTSGGSSGESTSGNGSSSSSSSSSSSNNSDSNYSNTSSSNASSSNNESSGDNNNSSNNNNESSTEGNSNNSGESSSGSQTKGGDYSYTYTYTTSWTSSTPIPDTSEDVSGSNNNGSNGSSGSSGSTETESADDGTSGGSGSSGSYTQVSNGTVFVAKPTPRPSDSFCSGLNCKHVVVSSGHRRVAGGFIAAAMIACMIAHPLLM